MIIFRNPGLIDVAAVSLFGASVKNRTHATIGQFGTGLKYAAAVVLASGDTLDLYTGGAHMAFGTRKATVRGQDFDQVTLGGEPLPFTTKHGSNWKPWQAFRELWSNAKDEGGTTEWVGYDDVWSGPRSDETVFLWSGPGAEKVWSKRGTTLLETEAIQKLPQVDVHPGEGDHLYYQGIRVLELQQRSRFTYNLTTYQALTEERMLAYSYSAYSELVSSILMSEDAEYLTEILSRDCFETKLPFKEASGDASKVFLEVSMRLRNDGRLRGTAMDIFGAIPESYSTYGYRDPRFVDLKPVERRLLKEAADYVISRGVDLSGWEITGRTEVPDGGFHISNFNHLIGIDIELFHGDWRDLAIVVLEAIAWTKRGRIERQLSRLFLFNEFDEPEETELRSDGNGSGPYVEEMT